MDAYYEIESRCTAATLHGMLAALGPSRTALRTARALGIAVEVLERVSGKHRRKDDRNG